MLALQRQAWTQLVARPETRYRTKARGWTKGRKRQGELRDGNEAGQRERERERGKRDAVVASVSQDGVALN
ncbi:hypothetical protein X777_08345 [Ooceraea biroi]|uniref:Uncharacterized protein n=1 Tax=Ooceraea biroi TaxID=2015173 RepID=A0A026WZA7_OOCBI|nr:hypothetical protein X777_08345 [Ooceraea biroi]